VNDPSATEDATRVQAPNDSAWLMREQAAIRLKRIP